MAEAKLTALAREATPGEREWAKELADLYGIDVNLIIAWLLRYGPALVQVILNLFGRKLKATVGAAHCEIPQVLLDHLADAECAAMESLAQAIAARHCAECCAGK